MALESRQAGAVILVYVAIGSALGGVARYYGNALVTHHLGDAFPWGTMTVNAVGSFLLGVILGCGIVGGGGYAFAAVGFCGGLTTFSTFSLQTLIMVSKQQWGYAAAKIFGSLLLCMLLLFLGYWIGGGLTS
ncbi:MAG: CrcB family protein [Verrucomicrobiota bacterium]